MPIKILVADDAEDVAEVVAYGARMTWPDCDVVIAANGNDALEAFARHQPDLVILDVSMPPPDGFAVCQKIRETSHVPILMLTVRDTTVDKVRALDIGADDYLTKPFDHLELQARLRALHRRATQPGGALGPVFTSGDLTLDYGTHEVRLRGELLQFTSTEYRLLEELARHAGQVLTHRHLLEQVWGPQYTSDQHYLKVFIRRLRQKLGDDADQPRFIQTEWGLGYRFLPPMSNERKPAS